METDQLSKLTPLLRKMNALIEGLEKHMDECPNCHLRPLLKSVLGNNQNQDDN